MAEPLTREPLLETPEMPGSASPALRLLRSSLPAAFRSRLRSARELDREIRDAAGAGAFATAVPALDRLLDGGLPRGQLVELVGGRTSGRFSTLLAVLAAATGVGEAAALVDLGDGLDPEAALALGADLERLLWLRPTTLKDALAAAEMLLASGFPLVTLDLGQPPVRGGRGVEAAWLRLARAARAHDAALLVGAPYRVSGTAAAVVLKAERARAAWQGQGASPRLLAGCASRLVLEKRRGQLTGRAEELTLTAPGLPRPAAAPARPEVRRVERPAIAVVPPLRRAAAG
ncbi:MAG TPA: hypothetical protein VIA62_02755 [Thermoanaerobaculia bacterium]|jgi:hypothetical protein|nr:hypothetical protein [Thermoanaerobaculia bacterium]